MKDSKWRRLAAHGTAAMFAGILAVSGAAPVIAQDGDPVLGRFIEAHNRAGVPLYLWYAPGEAEPRVLPQLLSQAMLRDLASGGGERTS